MKVPNPTPSFNSRWVPNNLCKYSLEPASTQLASTQAGASLLIQTSISIMNGPCLKVKTKEVNDNVKQYSITESHLNTGKLEKAKLCIRPMIVCGHYAAVNHPRPQYILPAVETCRGQLPFTKSRPNEHSLVLWWIWPVGCRLLTLNLRHAIVLMLRLLQGISAGREISGKRQQCHNRALGWDSGDQCSTPSCVLKSPFTTPHSLDLVVEAKSIIQLLLQP